MSASFRSLRTEPHDSLFYNLSVEILILDPVKEHLAVESISLTCPVWFEQMMITATFRGTPQHLEVCFSKNTSKADTQGPSRPEFTTAALITNKVHRESLLLNHAAKKTTAAWGKPPSSVCIEI